MDGWNTGFLLGWPIFRGELLVLGSEKECDANWPSRMGQSSHPSRIPFATGIFGLVLWWLEFAKICHDRKWGKACEQWNLINKGQLDSSYLCKYLCSKILVQVDIFGNMLDNQICIHLYYEYAYAYINTWSYKFPSTKLTLLEKRATSLPVFPTKKLTFPECLDICHFFTDFDLQLPCKAWNQWGCMVEL